MDTLLQARIGPPPPPPYASPAPLPEGNSSTHNHIVNTEDTGLSVTSGHIYLFVLAALFLMAILGAAAHCVVRHRGIQLAKLLERCSSGAASRGAGEPDFLQRRVQEQAEHGAAAQRQAAAAGAPPAALAARPAGTHVAEKPLVVHVVVNPDLEVTCAVEEKVRDAEQATGVPALAVHHRAEEASSGQPTSPGSQAPPAVLAPPPSGGSSSSPGARRISAPVAPNHLFLIVLAVILLLLILGAVGHCIAQRHGERFLDLLQGWRLGGHPVEEDGPNFLSRRVQERAQRRAAQAAAAAAAVAPPLLVVNPGFEVYYAVKEVSCSPGKSGTAAEPATCPSEAAVHTQRQSEPDLAAAGFMPCLFVFHGGAEPATPGGRLAHGEIRAEVELAACGDAGGSAAERQQLLASQTEPQRDGTALPLAPCDVDVRSSHT